LNMALSNELRKIVHADNNYIKKVKSRIHDIINKSKSKFLHDIHIKIEKIKVLPKSVPKSSPISNPLIDDDSNVSEIPNDYK